MEEDWISDLPDNVLERILSFLTLKEAVRTSLLSKSWRRMNVCSMLSNLNFSNLFNMIPRANSNVRRKNRRLMNVLDKILLERSHESGLGIEKLFLKFPCHNGRGLKRRSLELKLESWMKSVANPGLTELSVLMLSTYDGYWNFPLDTFAAIQSLQKLALMGFHFTSLSYGNCSRFSSLRSLNFCDVKLDDDVMQGLLKDSPLLDNLEVDCCCGLKVLQVRQPQLKMLEIRHNKALRKVELNAPKLEVLKLSPPKDTIFMETCLPCLRILKIKKSSSSTLKTLVEFQGLKLPIDMWFTEFLPLCPLLERLSIDSCPTLHNMNVSTPLQALKTLRLTNLENMVNVNVIASNLEKLQITAYVDLPVVKLDASDKVEVEIKPDLMGELDDLWYDRFANFLGFFNHSKAVKLSEMDEGGFIPKEKRNELPSPLYGTKSLELGTYKYDRRHLSEYVDYMLWLSPQATNLTVRHDPFCYEYGYYKNTADMVLECVYEDKETYDRSVSCACCEILAIKCWRHCLKEVKIHEFVGDEAEKESLKSWLWEKVENLTITQVPFNPDSIYGGKYSFYDQLFVDKDHA